MILRASITSCAVCTKERAIKSTPSLRTNSISTRSFSVIADIGKTASITLMPLRSFSVPGTSTRAVALSPSTERIVTMSLPSSNLRRCSGAMALNSSGWLIRIVPGSPNSVLSSNLTSSPNLSSTSPSLNGPTRNFGPCMSAIMVRARSEPSSTSRKALMTSRCPSWAP